MKTTILKAIVLAWILSLGPTLTSYGSEAGGDAKRGATVGPLEDVLGSLKLTGDQQKKIEPFKVKFAQDLRVFHEANKDAIRNTRESDRQKFNELMKPIMEKRNQFISDIKKVLSDEQKTKLDQGLEAIRAAHAKGETAKRK